MVNRLTAAVSYFFLDFVLGVLTFLLLVGRECGTVDVKRCGPRVWRPLRRTCISLSHSCQIIIILFLAFFAARICSPSRISFIALASSTSYFEPENSYSAGLHGHKLDETKNKYLLKESICSPLVFKAMSRNNISVSNGSHRVICSCRMLN